MSDFAVRFQIQSGTANIESVAYSGNRPCTKREAKACLSELQNKAEREYRGDRTWERELAKAIDHTKSIVDKAQSMAAQSSRNIVSPTFRYKDREFRVDIAIERGAGHFSE